MKIVWVFLPQLIKQLSGNKISMASEKVLECSKLLVEKNWKVSFVESASAGKMSYEFSTVPDSGKILIGGLVSYDARMKEEYSQFHMN